MPYSIWIVTTPLLNTRCFEEAAQGLAQAFGELGHEAPIVTDPAKATGTVIVLGANMLQEISGVLPKDMILFNLEQVHEDVWWFSPASRYLDDLRHYPVWDYSRRNIARLKEYRVRASYCGIGYASTLSRITKAKQQDIDVLFIGRLDERREQVLKALESRGVKVERVTDAWGEERDALIARSKLVVNIHREKAQVFELVRVSYLLANKVCVVSETGTDEALEQPYREGVAFAPYAQLADRCMEYLQDEGKREALAQRGFEAFSRQKQSALLKAALAEHEQSSRRAKETIFVQIASYRDPECVATLRDLYAKATGPERVNVGICWQDDGENDAGFLDGTYPGEVRNIRYAVADAKGAGWARNEAQKLHKGEEYTLQIQAHMRFEQGWDESLLDMLARAPSEKPIICLYPANYRPELGDKKDVNLTRTRVHDIGPSHDPQLLHLFCDVIVGEDPRIGLYPTPFWIGCFMFAKSEVFAELPADPHIFFWGEEVAYSARLFTHGYDLFQNDKPVVYHQWFRNKEDGTQNYRAYEDPRNVRTLHRVKHMLKLAETDDKDALAEIDAYGLGGVRTLEQFWQFCGVDIPNKKITPEANRGYFRGPVDENWGKNKIFVQIASYRDPECQQTVKDLFDKADHPDRIFVGLCWQYDAAQDAEYFMVPPPKPKNVRTLLFDWRDAQGVCWARWMTQSLWRGEEYTLQIDSHMRFAKGWDTKLIDELKACDSKKPILSASIAKYYPPDEMEQDAKPSVLRAGPFLSDGNIRNRAANLGKYPLKPLNAGFIAAGFMFSRSSLITEVPYDPYMYFDQEEVTLAMRYYTHGWDMFSARRPIVYHYYTPPGETPRPLHWSDVRTEEEQKTRYSRFRARALQRFNHLSGHMPTEDKNVLRDLALFDLGSERTLGDYQRYVGIDFTAKRVSEHAMRALFIKNLKDYLSYGKIHVPELDDKGATPPPLMSEKERLALPDTPRAPVQETKEPMKPTASKHSDQRIFVMIPSYRDRQCQHTVKDLFEKAARPERIFVGICWQFDQEEDKACFSVPYPRPRQVRERHYHPSQSKGANWARVEALALHAGEEYILQIDSHTRFEPGWDEALLELIMQAGPKTAISSVLPGYEPPADFKIELDKISLMRVDRMAEAGHPAFVHLGSIQVAGDVRPAPHHTPFIAAHFLFGAASMFREVPPDPHIFFHGDEVSHSARLWTHGYTVIQPERTLAYHRWLSDLHKKDENYKNPGDKRAQRSRGRVMHLLGLELAEDESVLAELDRYGHGDARELEAFWQFAGIDPEAGSADDNASKGLWHPELTVGKSAPKELPRIFVQIASYRDPECQHTVKELFEKANHPERIFAGICWQYIREEDSDFFEVPYPRPEQVRVIHIDARESMGVCWARAKVQSLWQGEEYTLQIDSHMRFEQGWDDALIQMLAACPGKAVLTTYPAGYTPPREIPHRMTFSLVAKQFDKDGIFTMTSKPVPRPPAPEPVKGAFAGACMLFGKSDIIREVPYDPHLYFFGEEITLTVRLWTHGYDIYHPQYPVMYHCWNRTGRRTHFDDHRNWGELNRLSFARVRHMLGTEQSHEPKVLEEMGKYGLGTVRSLAEYQAYSGVNFRERSISPNAYEGNFPASAQRKPQGNVTTQLQPAQAKPMKTASQNSGPRLTLQSPDVLVFDDFLPEDVYRQIHDFTVQSDFVYINTQGKVKRVWDLTNGFPLRSDRTVFYYANPKDKPENVAPFPSRTPYDMFVEAIKRIMPQVQHQVGGPGGPKGWEHFSVSAWLYPQGTGLSMHDDGAGVYTGAYVFFMNETWRPHWGGQLLVLDPASNEAIRQFKQRTDALAFHKKKFLHASEHDELAMATGFAQCVFPIKNRMVFIHPEAFHMVTQVTPSAGDNVRMSLAGFFHRGKPKG